MPLDQNGNYIPARVWANDAAADTPFDPSKWDEQDQAAYDDLNAVRAEMVTATQAALDTIRGGIPQAEYDTLTEIANELAADDTAFANFVVQLAAKAPLASPMLTGTPTAPNPLQTDVSQQIATTAYVSQLVTGVTQGAITSAAVILALGFTPATDTHLHDGRYYTKTEADVQQAATDGTVAAANAAIAATNVTVTAIQTALALGDSGDVRSVNGQTPDGSGGVVLAADDVGALAIDAKAADSELLGGVEGASYARNDAFASMQMPAGALGSGTDAANIEINQDITGADSFLQFNIGTQFAANFGLDGSTNDFFIGGWSLGAVKYRVWHAGNSDPLTHLSSGELAVPANGASVAWSHLQGSTPKIYKAHAICKVVEHGYSVGDKIDLSFGGSYSGAPSAMGATANGTQIAWARYGNFSIHNKTTGSHATATQANWRMILEGFW